MNTIQTKLDEARKELLDLSLRNPLINYRLLKARGVEVVDESPPHVYRTLVVERKTMTFLPMPETAEEDSLLFEDDEVKSKPAHHADTRLQTDYPSSELQGRLLKTHDSANIVITDQGVNTLYLTLGMLEWYESESSDKLRRAPLVLIPVEIDRTSVQSRFRVCYTGEDIGTNLSLQAKLKSEFGVQLPDLPNADAPEQLNLQNYCEEVNSEIRHISRWAVDASAIALGFFSFTKFLMYHDLDGATWPDDALSQHPLLQSLLISGFNEPEPEIPDSANIDEHLDPAETHHVVDTDSSQALAIHDVSQGRNLVIQGPPGTGKSQTITNLIAEAIANGKRVLFVAEKMAALEVVKRNLDKVGLGDACLELHSHKMNKKEVVDELKRTLELGQPQMTAFEQELERLLSNRDRLNSYCRAVNTPIGESGITPYEAYGELLAVERRLSGVEPPALDLVQCQHSAAEFAEGLDRTEELQILLKRMGIPINHPFWGSQRNNFPRNDEVQMKRLAAQARETVLALKDSSQQLAQRLNFQDPVTCETVESVMRAAQRALDAPNLDGIAVQSTEWLTKSDELKVGLSAGKRLNQLHQEYGDILIPEAWEQSVLEIHNVLVANGDKWRRFLSGKFWRARGQLKDLCAQGLPKAQSARLSMVDAILESQREQPRLEKIQGIGKQLYGSRWKGKSSNWLQLQEIAQYLLTLHQLVEREELPEALIDYLASNPDSATLRSLVAAVEEHYNRHPQLLRAVVEMIQLDETVRFGPEIELKARPFTEQSQILERWAHESEKVYDIVAYNLLVGVLKDSGYGEIVRVANVWSEASQFLSDLLKQAWYGAQVDTAMRERPILAGFASDVHQSIVESFRKRDRLSLEYNKAKVAYEHWRHLPKHDSSSGQLGVLKREFFRKRGHLPIRKLMNKAGNAVQAIKPVFMMSPLSVAKFLPPESVHFDWVLFDEASQVKPVDAFGAIIRGKQTVIVGDNCQLPPTDFFDKQVEGDQEDSEENPANDMGSVLDTFCAKNAPERMLRWHYRSRHESLIAVSNIEFYDSKLQLFPSPDALKGEVGLVYHHLRDTNYDRGGSRSNPKEARHVAERVMEHARLRPNLTLGVATFNAPQMEAVQNELEYLRREDPSCEQTFFNAHPHEPFFVKNLENVQGDERDIIFISIGYGRDANGSLTMNFGPLNQDGGERRLNVLTTRARRRCEVFTNLKGDDIDLSRTDARGVEVLKRYLKFAETGELDIPNLSGREAESPFETEVANTLRELGYQVDHQIGSAGYFIDLGVKDSPQQPGRYLLGIECDGAPYHSAQSARDRDRLRQQVLEGLGWRIHRIWSTDWFRNPNRELRKVAEAIEIAKAHNPSPPDEPSPEDDISDSNNADEELAKDPDDKIPHPDPEPSRNSFAEKYKLADLVISTNGLSLHEVPSLKMAGWIQHVVEIESPVHFGEVARRIATAVEVSRIGNRIQNAVKTAAGQAAGFGTIEIRGDFFYWKEQREIIVRDRHELPNVSRKIELIAPEEIEIAIKQVVSQAFGIESEDLAREVCRLFGFKSVSTEMRQRVELIIVLMIEREELTGKGDSLVLA